MGDLLKHLSDEWSVISAAPLTFVVLALLMAGMMYLVLNWYYAGRVDTLKDRIEAYKDRLSGATPEEAKARLDALQAQVDALKPRQLGAAKRQQITAAVAQSKGVIEIASEMSCPDCQAFAGELGAGFSGAGWTVGYPAFLGASNRALTGLGLVTASANLTPLESIVAAALRASSIPFDILSGGGRPGTIGSGPPISPDVHLQVNAKTP